ncbi:MAG TPA: AraC family transcriptional regulator, partial [Chitinophagaceae bacterium]|nr:AraC family transcriptional regulator [Chitinophagaceae bacterium]
DAKFKVQLLPGKTLRCVSINFSAGWLQKNVLCDIHLHHSLLQSFTFDADPFVLFESLSVVERRVNESLFDAMDQKEFGKFFWRSRVLNLLTAFFSRIADRRSVQYNGTVSHTEQIAAVQKQLVANIYKGLPDIGTMARQAAVSESLLKRYFRKIYGKNIYSYYQEKRMICAKRLLTDKNKTVTETASIMGYGSVSSFNNTFKRFFGLKPDKFQRTNMVAVDI